MPQEVNQSTKSNRSCVLGCSAGVKHCRTKYNGSFFLKNVKGAIACGTMESVTRRRTVSEETCLGLLTLLDMLSYCAFLVQ